MSDELLPCTCPWCGGVAVTYYPREIDIPYNTCGRPTLGGEELCPGKSVIVESYRWNARAPQPLSEDELALLREQLVHDQAVIREAHAVLNKFGAPTNGEEGIGKRQELKLADRIAALAGGATPMSISGGTKAMSDELLPCREAVACALRAWDDHWSNNDGPTQEMREMAMFKAIEASRAPQPLSEDKPLSRMSSEEYQKMDDKLWAETPKVLSKYELIKQLRLCTKNELSEDDRWRAMELIGSVVDRRLAGGVLAVIEREFVVRRKS